MSKQEWCERIATIIADYRAEDGLALDAVHVDRWVDQFVEEVRVPLLKELTHVLAKSYASKAGIEGFLAGLTTNEKLAGDDPASFWKGSRFLQIQQAGNSQNDMLATDPVDPENRILPRGRSRPPIGGRGGAALSPRVSRRQAGAPTTVFTSMKSVSP